MAADRDLDWEGMVNVRDLGGLATADGRRTIPGAVVRADHPSYLSRAGWTALRDHGINTIVALTTAGSDPPVIDYGPHLPAGPTLIRVDVEDGTDGEFMGHWAESGLWGTPAYYVDALTRWPDRAAAAVQAVAHAEPGGVVIHCSRGCDRTGLVALVLLDLVGVAASDIAADYCLSAERLRAREPDYADWVTAVLADRGTTATELIHTTLDEVEVETTLRSGGLTEDDLVALRRRLLDA